MEKLNVNGIDIAYVRYGKGVPIVLIHGYPLDHTIWDEIGPYLEKDFDLIIPDLRGFGESGVMESDHSIIAYATDIAALLSRLKIEKAILAGHSMGGYVALAFAQEFPERVSGLVMVSTQTVADTPENKATRLATAKQVMGKGVGIVVEAMTPKLSSEPRIRDFVKLLISHQQTLGVSNALNAMAGRFDLTELFTTFKFPTVIIHGDVDMLIPVNRGREMKAALPSAEYFELAGLGHMAMMENPRTVADAFRSFVK